MTLFIILATIKVVFLGAIYGRLDGGGLANVREWSERSLIMFFFVLACAPFAGLWALLAYLGAIGLATGHGQYFPSLTIKYIKPQGVDFIVKLFYGTDPRTVNGDADVYGMKKLARRARFGMFVTGTLVGLPACIIALCFGAFVPALLFSLTGVVKAFAYSIGYKYFKSTEIAEYVNGGGRNLLCLIAIFWYIL